jgi:hypothetical protein
MKPLRNSPEQFLRPAGAGQQPSQTSLVQNMKKHLILLALLIAIGRLNAMSVLDNFNSIGGGAVPEGTALGTFTTPSAAGGTGFTTGYEQPTGAVPVVRTNDLTLSLANYVSGQASAVNHWSVAAALGGLARRVATRSTSPLSGTIWFSFIASLQNANGDVALTFNGTFLGTGQFGAGAGMRVGLGHPSRPGALGVGPVASQANLSTITDGVNGAITANGFVPTDGTPGLVLGRISTDAGSGCPKVEVWYNPDVTNQASLPAPAITFIDSGFTIVPSTVTRLGYQVVRTATRNEVIDNVKVSDEPNAFDIVYKNAPLPLPVLSVAATVPVVREGQPTNILFSITSDRAVSSPLTVAYTLSGLAANGYDGAGGFVNADYTDPNFDTNTQNSSVTIPVGQSNATVSISVIDDALPEGDESVIMALNTSSEYVLGGGLATATILDNNDAHVSVQYMFTQTASPQVWDTNLTASVFSSAGVGGSYSTTAGYFVSPNASLRARGDITPATAADAVANGSFMSFSVFPLVGYGLNLTNLQLQALYANYLYQEPGAAAAVIFVRSSLDNFTADLASWVLQPDNIVWQNPWYNLSLNLDSAFTNIVGGVEFRLYIYDDTTKNQVGVRIDNLYLSGVTFPAVGVQQVSLTATADAAEPATPGAFTITRVGETTNALTVYYSVSGTASNGVDYVLLPGAATIPVGQSNVFVAVSPIDDELVEPTETVVLTLLANTNYGIVSSFSATVNLADDGDCGGLVGYLFNENDSLAASLSAVAAACTKQADKVNAHNAAAGPGLGGFGVNGTSGVGHGYATSVPHSAPSNFYTRGDYLGTSAADAVTGGDYISFTLAPMPGYALTLSNFSAYVKLVSSQADSFFLRSSLDNFAADLADPVLVPGGAAEDPYLFWSVPLTVTASLAPVEFRVYFYTIQANADILRLDDVAFQGAATARPTITNIAVASGTVTINFTGASSDAADAFKLQSAATVDGAYADDNSAVITGTEGSFQATTAVNGAARFYRVRR